MHAEESVVGRLVTYEANASRYQVVSTEGANGWSLIVDGDGRWVVPVAYHQTKSIEELTNALVAGGRSLMDAKNIATALLTPIE